jgi:hypothetical protein
VPGDDEYEQACLTWETFTFRQHPAIVVMPASAADVLTAVLFAREHHLPIGVQGGGHGHPYPMWMPWSVSVRSSPNPAQSPERHAHPLWLRLP